MGYDDWPAGLRDVHQITRQSCAEIYCAQDAQHKHTHSQKISTSEREEEITKCSGAEENCSHVTFIALPFLHENVLMIPLPLMFMPLPILLSITPSSFLIFSKNFLLSSVAVVVLMCTHI